MFESCRWNLLVCFYGLSPTSYLISTSSALKHCNLRHFSPLQKLTVNYNSSTYFYVVSGKCPLSFCSRANWAFLVYEWYIDCVSVCVCVWVLQRNSCHRNLLLYSFVPWLGPRLHACISLPTGWASIIPNNLYAAKETHLKIKITHATRFKIAPLKSG